jgi:hypothetical protein
MHLTLEDLARFYFQDRLSKFCPTEHDRPNTFEKEMFRYGVQHAQADIEKLEAENARLREALEFILEARQEIDVATIPKAGIDHAPEQVVVNFSCSYLRVMKAREALKGGE